MNLHSEHLEVDDDTVDEAHSDGLHFPTNPTPPNMTGTEPHAAFPSMARPSGTYGRGSGSRSGSSKNLVPVPTLAELATLIGQSSSLASIKNNLIQALESAADSEDQTAILQAGQNLDELPDADLGGLSAALVYILSVYLPFLDHVVKSRADREARLD